MDSSPKSVRIFCIEDNALLVLHLQMMIEEIGHDFIGSAARFEDLKSIFESVEFDLALVDIDLADGRTGGQVAQWLRDRGRPSLFITGQEQVAAQYSDASLGTIVKPVREEVLSDALNQFAATGRVERLQSSAGGQHGSGRP